MKVLLLHKKIIAYLFLSAYLAFFVTNVVHYHAYSLLSASSVASENTRSHAVKHFIADGSICLVSYFSNSILDLRFTSKNIKIFFAEPEKLILNTKKELPKNSLLASILYRAPPLVFS